MRTLASFLGLTAFTLAAAQPASTHTATPQPEAIAYKTVAEALVALESRDGVDVVVTHAEGWTTVNVPAASAQWSFTPKGHYAHPAAVRRVVIRGPDKAVSVDVQTLCEAPAEMCTRLRVEFEGLNDRLIQAVRARARAPMPKAP